MILQTRTVATGGFGKVMSASRWLLAVAVPEVASQSRFPRAGAPCQVRVPGFRAAPIADHLLTTGGTRTVTSATTSCERRAGATVNPPGAQDPR